MASLHSQRTIFLLSHAPSRPRPGSWCYRSSPSCAIGCPLLAERRQPGANFPCRLAVSTAVDWPCGAASCPNTSRSRPQALLGKAAIAAQGFRIDPILATPLRVSEPHVSNREPPDPNVAQATLASNYLAAEAGCGSASPALPRGTLLLMRRSDSKPWHFGGSASFGAPRPRPHAY